MVSIGIELSKSPYHDRIRLSLLISHRIRMQLCCQHENLCQSSKVRYLSNPYRNANQISNQELYPIETIHIYQMIPNKYQIILRYQSMYQIPQNFCYDSSPFRQWSSIIWKSNLIQHCRIEMLCFLLQVSHSILNCSK